MTIEELRKDEVTMRCGSDSDPAWHEATCRVIDALPILLDGFEASTVLVCMRDREDGEWGDKWRAAMLALAALPGKEKGDV
jgi:hypothetical protein